MYRLIVAEDNKFIARHIAACIERAMGKDIAVKTAYDGETAYEMMQEFRADMICTDIRMPMIDGLELIERSKKINPHLKSVIITAYSDFEVAKEAIKLRVDDYLLKPLEDEKLIEVIFKMCEQLDKHRAFHIQEKLKDVLYGYSDEGKEWLYEQIGEYQIGILKAGAYGRKGTTLPVTKKDIEEWIEEQYGKPLNFLVEIMDQNYIVILTWSEKGKKLHARGRYMRLFRHFCESGGMLNMYLSDEKEAYDRVGQVVIESINNLKCRIFLGESHAFMEEPEETQINLEEAYTYMESMVKRLEFTLKLGREEKIREFLEECMAYAQKKRYPAVIVKRIVTIIVEKFYSDSIYNSREDALELTEKCLCLCESYQDILTEIMRIYCIREKQVKGVQEEPEVQIEEFIRQNLYHNICLEDIAKHMNLSESYVVRIMKQKRGTTPMELYNRLRIEEAKKLMRENGNLKIVSISELLKFSDQRYFSKAFKGYTGMTPTEYKERKIEENKF